MKKFFSLVLALVMALSLTTVAFGAATEVATADALVNATKAGVAEVKLTADIILPAGQHVPVVADLVVDGNGHSITFTPGTGLFNNLNGAAGPGPEGITNNLTVKNLTMISTTGGGYAVVAKNGAADFAISFTNCHFEDMYCGAMLNGNVDPDPAATNAPMATISGSTFEDTEYGVSFVTEDCVDEVSFENNTMTGETSIQETFAAGSGYLTAPTVEISSGSFSSDVSAYVVPGMSLVNGTVVNNAGQFNTLTGGVGMSAATGTWGATLDAALADKTYSAVMQPYAPAVPEVKSFSTCGLIVTHKTNQTVNTYGTFVKVPTALNANYVFVSGSNIVYLANVPATNKYDADATAVAVGYNTAAAAKCNEAYVDDLTEAGTYYLYEDEYYEEVTFAQKEKTFNVNDVMVYAAKTTKVNVKDHAYKYDTLKTNDALGKTVTNVYCTACNTTFEFVDSSNEADAIKKFGAGNYEAAIAGVKGTIYVRTGYTAPILPSGTVVTPSTDKVTSAETFDAGIAMYVGMSVLAATGSAVVIGKKKD